MTIDPISATWKHKIQLCLIYKKQKFKCDRGILKRKFWTNRSQDKNKKFGVMKVILEMVTLKDKLIKQNKELEQNDEKSLGIKYNNHKYIWAKQHSRIY